VTHKHGSLGLDFGVEADELFIVESTVAVEIVTPNKFDGLVHTEAELTLQHIVSFLDGHDTITVTVKLDELTSYFSAPSINHMHHHPVAFITAC